MTKDLLTEAQFQKWRQKAGLIQKDYKKIYKKEDQLAEEISQFYGIAFEKVADWVTEFAQAESDKEYFDSFERFKLYEGLNE